MINNKYFNIIKNVVLISIILGIAVYLINYIIHVNIISGTVIVPKDLPKPEGHMGLFPPKEDIIDYWKKDSFNKAIYGGGIALIILAVIYPFFTKEKLINKRQYK